MIMQRNTRVVALKPISETTVEAVTGQVNYSAQL